jgi:hypothetical protein
VTIELPNTSDTSNRYDIKLEDTDGDSYTKMNVLLSANATIEFTFDDFDGIADNASSITIINNTGYTGYYLYVSPTSSDSWGDDMLGSDILSNGDSVNVRLPVPLSTADRYDIRLEDSDGDDYTKFNVLISANSVIEFTFDDIDW